MNTIVNNYHVRVTQKNNRINELLEECSYDIYGVEHIDMDMFVRKLLKETMEAARAGVEFGDGMEEAVVNYFGLNK